MNQALSGPREELSTYAPRIITINIHPDKIRDVIGKGGSTIRSITEETGAKIDIEDDGTITIATADGDVGSEESHDEPEQTARDDPRAGTPVGSIAASGLARCCRDRGHARALPSRQVFETQSVMSL